MEELLELTVEDLKKHLQTWMHRRSQYIGNNMTYDKTKLEAFNRVIEQINELILNTALKDKQRSLQ